MKRVLLVFLAAIFLPAFGLLTQSGAFPLESVTLEGSAASRTAVLALAGLELGSAIDKPGASSNDIRSHQDRRDFRSRSVRSRRNRGRSSVCAADTNSEIVAVLEKTRKRFSSAAYSASSAILLPEEVVSVGFVNAAAPGTSCSPTGPRRI